MNDFLAKYGYYLEKAGNQVIIHHKVTNFGCIHIIFVLLLIPTILLSFKIIAFAFVLIPITFFYFMEVDKRKKHARNTVIDFGRKELIVPKKKKEIRYSFSDATSVVTTSEHIGGYASSDRETTEEYRREVNILFANSGIVTIFSFVSDHEEEEQEVQVLVNWLEKAMGIH